MITNNLVTRTSNSKKLFREDTSFDRKNSLACYNHQSQWVVATYIHHEKWNEDIPHYKEDKLPKTLSRLRSKQPLNIVAYGIRITQGLNVSSYDMVAPYMPMLI